MGIFAKSDVLNKSQDLSSDTELASDIGNVQSSRIESTLLREKVEHRPISKDGQKPSRHAELSDLDVNELDHEFNIDVDDYPYAMLDSAHDLFAGVLYHEHLSKPQNFSEETSVDCFSVQESSAEWLSLDEPALKTLVKDASDRCNNVPALSTSVVQLPVGTKSRKALVFFIPLSPAPNASFSNSIPLTRSSVNDLYTSLSINPAFMSNMLGRPDYWAPESRWDQVGLDFLGFDFSCQHPRWNLFNQGALLSVYCKHDVQRDLTIYLISHAPNDTVISALRSLLTNATRHRAQDHISNILLESPLDIHVLLMNLNFEASKWHVARFRRFQWSVIDKVDDHLAGIESSDRSKLKDLTKKLQLVSQNADSLIANAEVFLNTTRALQEIVKRTNEIVGVKSRVRQRTADAIQYAVGSMEKQKRWFRNYKARKDGTMNLVYNLVTQEDALNNLELAAEMKKDSTSMMSIAAVTMVFLPGTFTASVFSAGVFEQTEGRGLTQFSVTGLLWLWVVITIPITVGTMLCYWFYKKHIDNQGLVPKVAKLKDTENGDA